MTSPDFLSLPPFISHRSPRLRLRTARVSDAAALMPMITDKTTMKFTSGVVANDLEVAERWLSARVLGKDVLNFVVVLGGDGEKEDEEEVVVGIVGSYHWPEVGYLMHPAHANKGYATEALAAFIEIYFQHVPSPSSNPSTTGYDYLLAETDSANLASHRVLLKNGFKLVEKLEASFESPMLGVRDTWVWKLGRPGVIAGSGDGSGHGEGGKRPVRILELLGMGRGVGAAVGGGEVEEKEEERFVPPVQ